MATLNLSVLKSRQNSNGKYFIYIAVTHKREVRYIKTEYEIDDLFQFEKGAIVCRKDEKVLNQRLKYVLSTYEERLDAIEDLHIYTCSQIKDILEGKCASGSTVTISEYMCERIDFFRKEGRGGYAGMNEYTLKKILLILGDLPLRTFNSATIEKFIRGMNNLSNGTIQMRLCHLKACINEAIKNGIVKYDVHPFAYIKMPKFAPRLLDITVEEFARIRDLKTIHKKRSIARDMFLLSFYLGGLNFADIVQIDFSSDTISYIRQKTATKKQGNKIVTLTIQPEARQIIKKYMKRNGKLDFGYKFSYSNLQRYLNRCIKDLGKFLDVKSDMCFYSARKTFSQYAFDLGIRTEVIEYCIGQSMKENRPIYNYVRVMQKQADAALRRVIDYTVNPESFDLDFAIGQ